MDYVIDIGIDGWKCDGTDPYILELIEPRGYAGPVGVREYADDYYGDFYFYTLSKNPNALIMSRRMFESIKNKTNIIFLFRY